MINSKKMPTIGFFPGFFDIGETYPLIKIAKRYQEFGGKVVIFSHGGEYEYLAKNNRFEIIRLEPIASGPDLTRYFLKNNDDDIIRLIKDHQSVFKINEIKALVQTSSYLDCILAAMYGKIPVISVVSGTLSTPYFKANHATFPDNLESYFTMLIPQFIKNKITNWHTLHYKGPITKKFNRITQKINLEKRFRYFQDIRMGNSTLISDDINFLGVNPSKDFPADNFIGPILSDELYLNQKSPDIEIKNHLKRPGKTILLTMGSSKIMKALFLQILEILNKTDYNVIATYTSLLKENEIPKCSENVMLIKFISNILEINKLVDLAIIHGGRGTVYNAAYSGKPAVGVPLNGEQQFNLDNLVRRKAAIRVSKTFFDEKKLLNAIHQILDNYENYLENSKALTKKLQKLDGGEKAAKRILEIVNN